MEDLTDDQFNKLWNVLAEHDHLADLSPAWSAKKDLRHLLALRPNRSGKPPTEADVQARWDALLAWCATNRHIPELANFRQTLTTWRQEIFNAVLTGAPTPAAKASTGSRNSTPDPRSATATPPTNNAAPASPPSARNDDHRPSHQIGRGE